MENIAIASTGIYLDTRRVRNDGTYPVKIRITCERNSKFYATKISMTKLEFEKVTSKNPRGEYKQTQTDLYGIEKKAISIIRKMDEFSFEEFERQFLNRKGHNKDLFAALKEREDDLRRDNKFSTADTYKNTLESFKKMYTRETMKFRVCNPAFLKKYEDWMLKYGKSETTISMYLRNVRYVFNRAIKRGDISDNLYPFGKSVDNKYEIPQPKNIKKALNTDEIKKIFEYEPEEGSKEQLYRDLWIFSYLCNGINTKDICLLKNSDIEGDSIYFRREKTRTTNRKSKLIEVFVNDTVMKIIMRWRRESDDQDSYIFPFLTTEMTEEQIHKKSKSINRMMNTKLKTIAKEVGIQNRLTTGTARHSFATMLKRKGAPNSFIGDSLGHSNIGTTENYLGSFENNERKNWSNKLTEF
ncbi:tyrosine-type recombinase/integrase [Maribellus mangrovi]|uniref:tyrosine-type recombinase/integrase n=1 Tax=Maribellus mangrovi TaxID=3133146 RepID=UPI0030ED8E11